MAKSEMKTFEKMARELPNKDEFEALKKRINTSIANFDSDNRIFKIEFQK